MATSLAQEQQADPVVGPVYRWKKGGVMPSSDQMSRQMKLLVERDEDLSISSDGILVISLVRNRRATLVPVVPIHRRKETVTYIHQQAHFGANKTIWQVQQRGYWPGMVGEIRRQVATCLACQQSKLSPHQHFHPRNHLHAGRPWQTVAIDLCGPLPITECGNTQILVIADHFTRWYDALPLPNGSAEVVAKALDERIFCYFGVPEEIHSDQGRQFESELLQQCCNIWVAKRPGLRLTIRKEIRWWSGSTER